MKGKIVALTLPLLLCTIEMQTKAYAQVCPAPSAVVAPELYPVGWVPWLADLKSWRSYDPSSIPGVGRLIHSPDGTIVGEPLAGTPTCNVLTPGPYTFVMQWQNNETTNDYIGNTDVIYLQQVTTPPAPYIRHSQLGSGLPVFCAGTFNVSSSYYPYNDQISQVNEVTEVTNFSGHYKPNCKCLGVLENKLQALNINTSNTSVQFMGAAQSCSIVWLGNANTKIATSINSSGAHLVTVTLQDQYGAVMPSVQVQLEVISGGGSLGTSSGQTNSLGQFTSQVSGSAGTSSRVTALYDAFGTGNADTPIVNGNPVQVNFATGG